MLKDNLVLLRKQRNLKQSDVAKVVNLSITVISKYERGEAEPDIQSLIKLSKFYHVSIDYLVDNAPSEKTLSELKVDIFELKHEDSIALLRNILDLIADQTKK